MKKKKKKKKKGLRKWYVGKLKKYTKSELERVEKIRKLVEGVAHDMAKNQMGMR